MFATKFRPVYCHKKVLCESHSDQAEHCINTTRQTDSHASWSDMSGGHRQAVLRISSASLCSAPCYSAWTSIPTSNNTQTD